MYVEMGIAIGEWMQNKAIRIYAIGKFNGRSLMHYHPAIKRVDKIRDVLAVECPEIKTEEEFFT